MKQLQELIFFFKSTATIGRMGASLSAFGGQWQSFEILTPEDNSPTYGGSISANLSMNKVKEVIQRLKVESPDSDAYTAFQIGRIGQVSATVVTHCCTHLSSIKIWKGYAESTQYVWAENINVRYSGQRTDTKVDGMEVIDGRFWREILDLIEVDRVRYFVSTTGGLQFREFLRRNKLSVHVETRGHYFVFHVFY